MATSIRSDRMWQEIYSVGIESIDTQHKEQFEAIYELEAAISAKGNWDELHQKIIQTTTFFARHCELEESLMDMLDFHDASAHKASHRQMLGKLETLKLQALNGNDIADGVHWLKIWLDRHIHLEDWIYATSFRERLGINKSPS